MAVGPLGAHDRTAAGTRSFGTRPFSRPKSRTTLIHLHLRLQPTGKHASVKCWCVCARINLRAQASVFVKSRLRDPSRTHLQPTQHSLSYSLAHSVPVCSFTYTVLVPLQWQTQPCGFCRAQRGACCWAGTVLHHQRMKPATSTSLTLVGGIWNTIFTNQASIRPSVRNEPPLDCVCWVQSQLKSREG